MSARKLTGALAFVEAAAEKLRKGHGQAYADPTLRALHALTDVLEAAHSACEAKGIYYEQKVDNEDALDVALTLWADRMDSLDRALASAREVT